MARNDDDRCECGGKLKYYDGALGYEAMRCLTCGYDWNAPNSEQHKQQVAEYQKIKWAVTKPLLEQMAILQNQYDRLCSKVAHGCTDATCDQCDNLEAQYE